MGAVISQEGVLKASIVPDATLNGSVASDGAINGTIVKPEQILNDEALIRKIVERYFEENPIDSQNRYPRRTVTLLASDWVGENSPYYQTVYIDGVTENSKVNLSATADQLEAVRGQELVLVAENYGGTVVVKAVGEKPQNDFTVQATIKEVADE